MRSADALAPVVGLPAGIRLGYPGDPDEWVIDMPIFEAFVDALVDRYQRSTHLILRSLMEGFIATALVLVERGGGMCRPWARSVALTCLTSLSPRTASAPALPPGGWAN